MAPSATKLTLYLRLGRVSNLPTVWTNVLAGIALGAGRLAPIPALSLMLAASAAYVGGMFLNDAFDRGIDARERPERPIPSGQISAGEVFIVGFGLLTVALLGIVLTARAFAPHAVVHAGLAGAALCGFIVLYDAWHKENPLSPFVMGLCRGAVYVSAALASGGGLTSALLLGAAALTAYVVGLTFVARQENRRTFEGWFPFVLLAAPIGVAALGGLSSLVGIAAAAAFVAWVIYAVSPLFRDGPVFVPGVVIRLIAGIALLDGMVGAAHGSWPFAVGGLAGLGATLGMQRWVRGT